MRLLLPLMISLLSVEGLITHSISTKRLASLFAGKHLNRYGNFIDTLDRPRNVKMEKKLAELNLDEDDLKVKNGRDLRKMRPKNLEEIASPKVRTTLVPVKESTFSAAEVLDVLKCLNLTLNGKKREELSQEERVGLIDWVKFDIHAEGIIKDFENARTKKRVHSWIIYHVGKRDLVIDGDRWIWDQANRNKRGAKVRVPVYK